MKTSTTLGLATAGVAAALVAGFVPSSDAAVTADVTGTETHAVVNNSTIVKLNTDKTPTDAIEGKPVEWKLLVGPAGHTLYQRLYTVQGADETLTWKYTFPRTLSTRQVQIYKNGILIDAYNFKP